MANEKDIAEKVLEAHDDVFADIINVVVFDGEQTVTPDSLEAATVTSALKIESSLHEQERDVAMYWKDKGIVFALFGLENQTAVDKEMPLRVISYDGAAYKQQYNQHRAAEKKREKGQPPIIRIPTHPVATIVLYFGEKPWNSHLTLSECFEVDIPEKLKPFINDYKTQVIEVAFLPREKIDMFKSDFWYVADFVWQKRVHGRYVEPSPNAIKYVDEVFKLLATLTKDNRYLLGTEIKREGGVSMCDFLNEVEKRGETRGEARGKAIGEACGRADGEKLGRLNVCVDLVLDKTLPLEEAVRRAGVSVDEFKAALAARQPVS